MNVNILVRDVPEEVRDVIVDRARARGQSMQAFLYELISLEAARNNNIGLLQAVRAVGGGGSAESFSETVEMLHSLRSERENILANPERKS